MAARKKKAASKNTGKQVRKRKATKKKAGGGRGGNSPNRTQETDRAPARKAKKRPSRRKAPPPPDWGPRFIEKLRETRNVSQAADAVGKGRATVYGRRDRDEAFQKEWDDAVFVMKQDLKATAMRLAIEGYADPLVIQEIVPIQEGEGENMRVVQRRQTRVIDRRRYDASHIRFMIGKLLPDEFGGDAKGNGDDKYRRAEEIAALVEAMRCSVPREPDPESDGGTNSD